MMSWNLICWTSLLLLLLTWVIYPVLMGLAARSRREATGSDHRASTTTVVDIVLATREPPSVVQRRIAGLRVADPDVQFGRTIIAVDHRAATPLAEYKVALEPASQVVKGDAPGGKAAALNAGVRAASADFIVLLDSAQENAPRSIARLIEDMHRRPECGAISGAVRQSSGDRLMDLYWTYELMIRRGQDALHSIVSTSGQLTIVRRALWQPMPPDLICDDLFLTMHLVLAGHRVGFCEEAASIDTRVFSREQHFQRKTRTLTGLYQFIAIRPAVLLPWRNPIWVHLVIHKVMRFATPFLTAIILARLLVWALWQHARGTALVAVGLAGLLALLTLARPRLARGLIGQLLWTVRVQSIPLIALYNGLRRDWSVWQAHRPADRIEQHG